MTFIPAALTRTDPLNSTISHTGTFIGTSSSTSGYTSLLLSIDADGDGILQVFFSLNDTGTYPTDPQFRSGYVVAGTPSCMSFPVRGALYYVAWIPSSLSTVSAIVSILQVNPSLTLSPPSLASFDQSEECRIDAFGKQRVSNPTTLLDLRFPSQSTGSSSFLSNSYQFCTKTNGAYSIAHTPSTATFTGSGAGYALQQSRLFTTYQPGKSLLIKCSGIIGLTGSAPITMTARIGYFSSTTAGATCTVANGIYFQYSTATGISANISSGGTVQQSVNQADWNIDPMNGAGSSGVNLDWTKAQLFIIDAEWLGVGRVRFGFYILGKIVYCHEFINLNLLTGPYATSINLPIAWALTGTQGTTSSLTQICATVISEGGYNPLGRPFSVVSSSFSLATGTEVFVMALRGGGSNYDHQIIIPLLVSLAATTLNEINCIRIRYYPAPASPGTITWTDADSSYSVCQYSSTITPPFSTASSIVLFQELFDGKGDISISALKDTFTSQVVTLTSDIDHVSDILVITCERLNGSGSSTGYATLQWSEIS